MKASELRELTDQELREKENNLAEELFALRLQQVTGQLERFGVVKQTKKDLARVLTVLRERQNQQ